MAPFLGSFIGLVKVSLAVLTRRRLSLFAHRVTLIGLSYDKQGMGKIW